MATSAAPVETARRMLTARTSLGRGQKAECVRPGGVWARREMCGGTEARLASLSHRTVVKGMYRAAAAEVEPSRWSSDRGRAPGRQKSANWGNTAGDKNGLQRLARRWQRQQLLCADRVRVDVAAATEGETGSLEREEADVGNEKERAPMVMMTGGAVLLFSTQRVSSEMVPLASLVRHATWWKPG